MNTLLQGKSQTAFVCVWILSSCSEALRGPIISFFAYVMPYETCNQYFPFWCPQKCEDFHCLWASYVCVRTSCGTQVESVGVWAVGDPWEARAGGVMTWVAAVGQGQAASCCCWRGRVHTLADKQARVWMYTRTQAYREDSSRPISLRRDFTRTPMTTSRRPLSLSFILLPPSSPPSLGRPLVVPLGSEPAIYCSAGSLVVR